MDARRKFFLFKQSAHFCAVPWNHFQLFVDGVVKTCSSGKTVGDLKHQDLDNILHGHRMREIKSQLLDDIAHDNCRKCHDLTVDDYQDLRNHYNPMFIKNDVDYDKLDQFQLNSIDLHWDNTCNLKCVYCNAQQSSSIASEQKIYIDKVSDESIQKVIDMIVDRQWELKELYLSGGEPLLIKHNWRLFDRLTNLDLPIRINSNITHAHEQNQMFRNLSKFRNVLWTISAESTGDRFQYIRNGCKWSQFLESIERIKGLGHRLRLNSVFFVGSISSIFDTIEYFATQHQITDVTINQIFARDDLEVRHAPALAKSAASEKLQALLARNLVPYQGHSHYNIMRCQRELDRPPGDSKGYVQYFDRLDQIRGTSWRDLFPELVP